MRRALTAALIAFLLTRLVSAGELHTEEIESEATDRVVELNVLLPDGYEEHADRRYPVIYLLHGYGGSYTEWQRVGIEEEAKGLPAIIVMPEGDQSFYINFHDDPKARWEDHIVEEVLPFIDSKYRTDARREGRAVSGLSMGGYGALMLALRHPDLFASAASHSGALSVPNLRREGGISDRIREIFGPDGSEEREKYDLVGLVEGLSPGDPPPHIYLDCGSGDFLLGANRAFVKELSQRGVRYEYREVPGAHNHAYWKRNVRYSLERQLEALEEAAKHPRPAPARQGPEAVAGIWDATATLQDGGESSSVFHLTLRDGKLGGRVEWQGGERRAEFDRVSFENGRLRVEVDYDRDGRTGVIYAVARLDGDRLDGKWGGRGNDGTQYFEEDWKAERREPARKEGEREFPRRLLGSWDYVVTTAGGRQFESRLELEEKDGKLAATFSSPRFGDSEARSVRFEDGQIRMEVERTFGDRTMTFVYEGKLTGEGLEGKVGAKESDRIRGDWKATPSEKEREF